MLFTSNCLVPPKTEYKDRIFTSGPVGFEGCVHIRPRPAGGQKDLSPIIEKALTCDPPKELEQGTLTGGFGHGQVPAMADKIIAAVKTGKIKRFVVMAGCDARQKSRSYYTEVANSLPPDAVILTAGCAKYRYNKLDLGDLKAFAWAPPYPVFSPQPSRNCSSKNSTSNRFLQQSSMSRK